MVSGKKEMDIGFIMGETSSRSRYDLSLKEVMDVSLGENMMKVNSFDKKMMMLLINNQNMSMN
ncbi:hypothetical protein Godav_015159 [Gossypium davidsonii]|uniref:Uncharacterized protein n=1 Tax=Gossypium davidsonii TaxID=34287 RepID=A0A7J8RM81_GOSDV|nr:hypothetical protein [Gossypium davidsonii]